MTTDASAEQRWIKGEPCSANERVRPEQPPLSAPWSPGALISRFDAAAARHADRVAVDDGVMALTFAELRQRALRLAWALTEADLEPGRPVAAVLPASVLYPVALLAALAAGRPLAPVDATHPPERQRAILAETRPVLALVDPRSLPDAELMGDTPIRLLNLEAPADALDDGAPTDWPAASGDPLAGVAFTSGSMGRPKGLAYRQSAIWAMATEHIDLLGIGADDVILSLASLGAGGNQDLLSGLLTGARVRMLELKAAGLAETVRVLREDGVTLLSMIPLVLRTLMGQPEAPAAFARMRAVTTGGDRLYGEDVALFRSVLPPGAAIRFTQGSTETGVVFHWVLPPDGAWAARTPVPSGRVGAHLAVRVVDPDTSADAEAGELLVSGETMAAGAWQNGRLTAGAFLAADAPGGRLYDGGDLVERTPDGLFRFVGRRDRQIKMRGLRADPAEVEAALLKAPGVAETAVVPRYTAGEAVFVAFVVPESLHAPPEAARLRAAAAQEVPPHMVPAEVRLLPALPRLANYKVDLAALVAIDRAALPTDPTESAAAPDVPAADPAIAVAVASAWRALLGPGAAGRAFDAAGGDSLKLLQTALHIEESLGRPAPLDCFDLQATEADLATRLTRRFAAAPAADARPVVVLCPGLGGDEPRLAAFRQCLSDRVRFEVVAYPGLERSPRDLGRLGLLVEAALARVEAVAPTGPVALAGYSAGGVVAYEAARRLARDGRTPRFLGLIDLAAERGDVRHWLRTERPGAGGLARLLREARAQGLAAALKDLLFHFLLRLRAFGLLRRLILAKARVSGAYSVAFVRKILIEHLRGPAILAWRPAAYSGPVTLFRADAQRAPEAADDLGWGAWVADLTVRRAPGDHYTMLLSPQVGRLAALFAEALQAAPATALSPPSDAADDGAAREAS